MYYEIYVENDDIVLSSADYGSKSLQRAKFIMSVLKEKYEDKNAAVNNFKSLAVSLYDKHLNLIDRFFMNKNKQKEAVKYLNSILLMDDCFNESKNNFLDGRGFYEGIIPRKGTYDLYKLIYAFALTLYENWHEYGDPKNEIPEYLQMPLKEREKYSKLHDELYKKASERRKRIRRNKNESL